jgi:hypothetical protein
MYIQVVINMIFDLEEEEIIIIHEFIIIKLNLFKIIFAFIIYIYIK